MSRYYINPGKVLKQIFPEQTKNNLSIIIWTIVFIADLVLVYFTAGWLGIDLLGIRQVGLMLFIAAGLALFWLETFIYNHLIRLFR